ncbi:MAG: anaerobic ribonucleoside-triphosphate reductase activating protein [Thermoanaerobacteraceae bacterium]|nr:anaerobic ribonucleoside-triphosphate reductase activating protein [Thermoanaerobacteraceae bacterium]
MIYDLMPVSVADYPGNVAATVFVSGCNFHCPYCHNSSIIVATDKGHVSEEEILNYLVKRGNLLDGVCITGGEPTLWIGLEEYIKRIRDIGFKVKLDTNGARPGILKKLIAENLLDYIAMDIKAPLDKYGIFVKDESDISRVEESTEIIMNSRLSYEFRTTVHEKILDLNDFEKIGEWLQCAHRYVIQGYKYSDDVLDKDFCGNSPCDIGYLEKIKDAVDKYFDEVLIRA